MPNSIVLPVFAAALGLVATAAPATATPAPECTFDRGQTTCLQVEQSYVYEGPFTTEGETNDGRVISSLCPTHQGAEAQYFYARDVSLLYRVTTTTTTVQRGREHASGRVVSQTTVEERYFVGPSFDEPSDLICVFRMPQPEG